MAAPATQHPPTLPSLRPPLSRLPSSAQSTTQLDPRSSTAQAPPPSQRALPPPLPRPQQPSLFSAPSTLRKPTTANTSALADDGSRTIRKPSRVLQSGGNATGSEGTAMKRSASGLPSSTRPSNSLSATPMTASASLRTFPSSSTASKRTLPSIPASSTALFPSSDSPQTPRTRAKSRSAASQALTRSLSRSTSGRGLAKRAEEDSPQTVRPARRTLAPPSQRTGDGGRAEGGSKKPSLAGHGRPRADNSPSTSRKSSNSSLRASSTSSTSAQTPLRTSTRRSSAASSAALSPPIRPVPPPPSTLTGADRTLHRRPPTGATPFIASSAIPIAGRTLKKPFPSSFSASSTASTSSLTAPTARSRVELRSAGPPTLAAPGGVREATTDQALPSRTRASQAIGAKYGRAPVASSLRPPSSTSSVSSSSSAKGKEREHDDNRDGWRDSWVTDPDSLSARPSFGGGEGDQSWETEEANESRRTSRAGAGMEEFATPQRASSGGLPGRKGMSYLSPPSSSFSNQFFLSPPSNGLTASSSSTSHRLSISLSPATSSSSHLLPFPPSPDDSSLPTPRPAQRQLSLLRSQNSKQPTGRRNKPRDSASLEEILRMGMMQQQRDAGGGLGGRGGGGELDLLLDEGSSVMMREDLGLLAGGGGGEDDGLGPGGGGTPWRGRVMSLSMRSSPGHGSGQRSGRARTSTILRSLTTAAAEEEEQPSTASSEETGMETDSDAEETQLLVLPLRPTTNEAVSLRRQLESLQAELSSLRSASTAADEPANELQHLRAALAAANSHNAELQRAHEQEVEAMEADLAILARSASFVPPSVSSPPSSTSLVDATVPLALVRAEYATEKVSKGWEDVEERARRERREIEGEREALRALVGGLEGWGRLLISV